MLPEHAMVKAIADLVAAVAWPGVVLFLAYMFREPVASFMDDVVELTFLGVSLKRKVRDKITEAGKDVPRKGSNFQTTASELRRARDVAELVKGGDPRIIRGLARELAEEYESLRDSCPSGDERTKSMEETAAKMRAIGRAVFRFRYDLKGSNSPGDRLTVIASLQVRRDYDFISWLTDRVMTERPFISYHAMRAFLRALQDDGQNDPLDPYEAINYKNEVAASLLRLRTLPKDQPWFANDFDRVRLLEAIEKTAVAIPAIERELSKQEKSA
jgi:hypothetical protein